MIQNPTRENSLQKNEERSGRLGERKLRVRKLKGHGKSVRNLSSL